MSSGYIKVAVRIRPLLSLEQKQSNCSLQNLEPAGGTFQVLPDQKQLVIKSATNSSEIKSFSFDYVFDQSSNQKDIFKAVQPLVDSFLLGTSASILAYGQTGSGKTFSMGISKELLDFTSGNMGIVPRAIQSIFAYIHEQKSQASHIEYQVTASFLELYNEDLVDLLDRQTKSLLPRPKPQIREENGILFISNIHDEPCASVDDCIKFLERGSTSRTTHSTEMNDTSSRSHAIFTITLKRKESSGLGGVLTTTSKFNFVDLAGSERLKKTGSEGDRKKEGISINQGLLALGNVISALGDETKKATHVPYRDSKLTRLLQESLGGNSQTLMISCVSADQSNYSESLATLVYANRTRNIKNKISINQEWDGGASNQKEIKSLQEALSKVQAELSQSQIELLSSQSAKEELEARIMVGEKTTTLLNRDLQRISTERAHAIQTTETLSKKIAETEFSLAKQSDNLETTIRSLNTEREKVISLEERLLSTTRMQTVQLKRLEELSSEKAQLWMEKSSISSKLSDVVREKDALMQERFKMDSLLAEKRYQTESLERKMLDLTGVHESALKKISTLQNMLFKAQSDALGLTDALAVYLSQASLFESLLYFTDETLTETQDKCSSLELNCKKEFERSLSLESQLVQANSRVKDLVSTVSSSEAEISILKENAEAEMSLKDLSLTSINGELENLQKEYLVAEESKRSLVNLLAERDAEVQQAKSALVKEEEKASKMSDDSIAKLSALKEELESLQKEYLAAEESKKSLVNLLAERDAEVKQAKSALVKEEEKASKMSADSIAKLSALKGELESLQKEYLAAEESKKSLVNLLAERDAEVKQAKSALVKEEEKASKMSADSIAKLSALKQEMKEKVFQFETEKTVLKSDLSSRTAESANLVPMKESIQSQLAEMANMIQAHEDDKQLALLEQHDVADDYQVEEHQVLEVEPKTRKRKSVAESSEKKESAEQFNNENGENQAETSSPKSKKVNLRKKKDNVVASLKVAKKSGGVLTSIAKLMSSAHNSPHGVRTRARAAKAKDSVIIAESIKPKIPLKYKIDQSDVL